MKDTTMRTALSLMFLTLVACTPTAAVCDNDSGAPTMGDAGPTLDADLDYINCEPFRAAYESRLDELRAIGCAGEFESFGCILTAPATQDMVSACEPMLASAQSCAALQNALWACEGGH